MAKKLTNATISDVVMESVNTISEKTINFNEDPSLTAEPSKNILDHWTQITLSLAGNGGYTIKSGNKYVLYVAIQEKVKGKTVHSIKSFIVSKQELSDLQSDSAEFSLEIESMLIARGEEESTIPVKKDEIRKPSGSEITGSLRKSLEAAKKKEPISPVI